MALVLLKSPPHLLSQRAVVVDVVAAGGQPAHARHHLSVPALGQGRTLADVGLRVHCHLETRYFGWAEY